MVLVVGFLALCALFIVALVFCAVVLLIVWLIAYNYFRFFASNYKLERAFYKNTVLKAEKLPGYKDFEEELDQLIK